MMSLLPAVDAELDEPGELAGALDFVLADDTGLEAGVDADLVDVADT